MRIWACGRRTRAGHTGTCRLRNGSSSFGVLRASVSTKGHPMGGSQSALASGRLQSVLAYMVLLATCAAGALHAPWWAVCAGACALTLISLLGYRTVTVPQLKGVSEPVLVLASIVNAAGVTAAAFVFGHAARWFWGL